MEIANAPQGLHRFDVPFFYNDHLDEQLYDRCNNSFTDDIDENDSYLIKNNIFVDHKLISVEENLKSFHLERNITINCLEHPYCSSKDCDSCSNNARFPFQLVRFAGKN